MKANSYRKDMNSMLRSSPALAEAPLPLYPGAGRDKPEFAMRVSLIRPDGIANGASYKTARRSNIDRTPHKPRVSPFAKDKEQNLAGPNKELFLRCLSVAMAEATRPR
jgi:hypothetical protein